MLYRSLFSHYWKGFLRQPSWSGLSIGYTILLGLLALYFLLVFTLSGFFIGHLIETWS